MKQPPKARLVVLTMEMHTAIPLRKLRDARRVVITVDVDNYMQRIYPVQCQANVIRVVGGKKTGAGQRGNFND